MEQLAKWMEELEGMGPSSSADEKEGIPLSPNTKALRTRAPHYSLSVNKPSVHCYVMYFLVRMVCSFSGATT